MTQKTDPKIKALIPTSMYGALIRVKRVFPGMRVIAFLPPGAVRASHHDAISPKEAVWRAMAADLGRKAAIRGSLLAEIAGMKKLRKTAKKRALKS